jgi:phosphoserine aminotransferase
MRRVDNFNAGPSALPLPALERAQSELCDFEGTGMSIMEHSHRGKAYEKVHFEAIALLKELCGIGDDRVIVFVQGGASQVFATLPMNFLKAGQRADYVITGGWSEKALEETKFFGEARAALSTAVEGTPKYRRVPTQAEIDAAVSADAAYVHVTSNNTLFGTQYAAIPTTKAPLVVDMSSDIMCRPVDFSKISMVYAGAQKNIGPSGVTILVLDKAFLASARDDIATIFRYGTHAKNDSLYNTPPTFGIYLMRNVLAHTKSIGGLDAIARTNEKKAARLYGALDTLSSFYTAPVEKASRSTMNVTWRTPTPELDKRFVEEAVKKHMVGLAGHRSTGGLRASTYNAVSFESVDRLATFLEDFAKTHG